MRLATLADSIGAKILMPGRDVTVGLDQVYAGDRISDLLNEAKDNTLLVSNLASTHLIRVAELMDVPGICLVGGQQPDAAMLATAREHGTLLMVSPAGLFETCGRIHHCLAEEKRSTP
jgi:hypothetical protein